MSDEKIISELFKGHVQAPKVPNGQASVAKFVTYCGPSTGYELKAMLAKLPDLPPSKTLVGLEIEVEDIYNADIMPDVWMVDKDGSLRDGGHEFKSFPLKAADVPIALAALWISMYKINKNKPKFSWRTSIHAHLNCQDLTQEEIYRILLLYCVFEPALFEFVGERRDQTVYCVPLCSSDHWYNIHKLSQKKGLMEAVGGWLKYTAVNIMHLKDFGTIEFRHLGGTDDLHKIVTWVGLLLCIYNAAIEYKTEELRKIILDLNVSSKYDLFRKKVFGHLGAAISCVDFQKKVSRGVRFAKECMAKEIGEVSEATRNASGTYEYFQKMLDAKKKKLARAKA